MIEDLSDRSDKADVVFTPGRLTMPQSAEARAVLHRDWVRICREAELADERVDIFREAGWACVGVAVAAFTAWIGWGPVHAGMSAEEQVANSWQGPTLIIAFAAFALLAAVMFVADRRFGARHKGRLGLLRTDMDEVWEASKGASSRSE